MQKEKLKTQKGITLIALIITIIVMLILVGVTVTVALQGGLFNTAKDAAQKTAEAVKQETEMLQYEYQIAKAKGETSAINFDEYVLDKKYGLKIGDYVNYDPTKDSNGNTITATYTSYSATNASTEKNEGRTSGHSEDQVFNLSSYTGGWRILGIENGQIELISADIIGPDIGGAYGKYVLSGQAGYMNGVEELDAISSIYGQGKHATGARSVTVEDINNITGYDPEKGTPYRSGTIEEYGAEITYYWDGTERPYYQLNDNVKGNLGSSHASGFSYYDYQTKDFVTVQKPETVTDKDYIITLKNNYYAYYPETLTYNSSDPKVGLQKSSVTWKMLFENTGYFSGEGKYYWLASTFEHSYYYYGFLINGLRVVHNGFVSHNDRLYCSNGSENASGVGLGIRPVVTLSSDVTITKDATNDGSTAAKACTIGLQ